MLTVLLISAALVIGCVTFHGFTLQGIARWLFHDKKIGFYRVSVLIFVAILAHVIEIIFFEVAYAWMIPREIYGSIAGVDNPGGEDLFYFSAVTYTTTGYGDLTPVGKLRLFATVEALTGLIMITWTASFAFLVMQRYWTEMAGKIESDD